MNPRRLYRCREDRKLAGVAAGMAEYLDIDPTVIRIAWILSAFLGGFTILLYVILAFIIPPEPLSMSARDPEVGVDDATVASHIHNARPTDDRPGRAGIVVGVLLVVFGAVALLGEVIPNLAIGGVMGPVFVLALGVALLVGAVRRPAASV